MFLIEQGCDTCDWEESADVRCCRAQYLVIVFSSYVLETMDVCIRRMFACISVVVTVRGSVGMFEVYCEL